MDRMLNVLAVLSVVVLVVVLRSVRREHIRVEYSVSWLGAALTLLVLSRFPGVMKPIADFLGIEHVPLALVFLILVVFVGVFYRFSAIISELKDNNIALAQRVAILEFQLRSSNEEREKLAAR